MVHTLKLDNYSTTPRKLVLGTNSSFGTESIKIERGAGWDGLNLTATWHIPGREEPLRVALLDGDAMDVPPEVTKEAKDGVLVLAGLASGVQRASCNVEYLILEQAGVYGGTDAEPTPELAAQVLEAALQAKADAEAAAEDAADAKANADKAGPYADAALSAKEAAEAASDDAQAAARAAKASEDEAAKSAADADSTANSIKDSMAQISENKEAVSKLKDDLDNKLPKSPANWEAWTAEEQAAARERIGLDKPFELIETITIDEESVNVVKRDAEPDGTAYNFESMMVRVTSFNTNMSGLFRTIFAHMTGGYKFDVNYSSMFFSTSFNDFYLLCEKRNGIWNIESILSHTNGVARGYYAQPDLLDMDKNLITGVSLYFSKSNFIVGTEIKIYGVRA